MDPMISSSVQLSPSQCELVADNPNQVPPGPNVGIVPCASPFHETAGQVTTSGIGRGIRKTNRDIARVDS